MKKLSSLHAETYLRQSDDQVWVSKVFGTDTWSFSLTYCFGTIYNLCASLKFRKCIVNTKIIILKLFCWLSIMVWNKFCNWSGPILHYLSWTISQKLPIYVDVITIPAQLVESWLFLLVLKDTICFNTLRPKQMDAISQTTFSNCIFLNENVGIPIKISLMFVPNGPINNIPALIQIMAWHHSGDKPLSEPMVVNLQTHLYASLVFNELIHTGLVRHLCINEL